MPTIPTYSSNIALQPAPGAVQKGMSLTVPEGAFGTGIAVAGMKAADLYAKAKDDADDLRATEAATDFVGKQNAAELKARNENILGRAVGLGDTWEQQVAGMTESYRETLSPQQFEKFRRRIAPQVLSSQNTIRAHEIHQYEEHRKATDAAHLRQLEITAASGRVEDVEGLVQQAIAYADSTKEGQAVDQPLKDKYRADIRDGVLTGVIRRQILDGNLDAAAALVAQNSGLKERGAFEGQIKALRREREAETERAAQNTVGGLYLRHYQAGNTAKSLAEIMASPEFRSLSPRDQASATEHMQARVEHTQSWGQHQADRLDNERWQQKSREHQMKAWRDQELHDSPATLQTFLSLMDHMEQNGPIPEPLLWSYEPFIGAAHVRTLAVAGRQLKNQAQKFQIDPDLIHAVTPPDKTGALRFRAITEDALVRWKEQNPGKVPSREEQAKILRAGHVLWMETRGVNEEKPAWALDEASTTAVPKWFYDARVKDSAADKTRSVWEKDDQIASDWQKIKEVPKYIYEAGKKAGQSDDAILERYQRHQKVRGEK